MDVSLLGAFLGGVLTLLSPCSAMLLPAFFSFAFGSPTLLLRRVGIFYLGLVTTLVPLGVLAGTVGAFVSSHRFLLIDIGAVLVIVFGVLLVLDVPLPFMRSREDSGGTSPVAVYLLGTVYGLSGVCAGPLLGAVLTVALLGGSPLHGGLVLAVFAAGMALPLLVLALVWRRIPAVRTLVRPREVRWGPLRTTVSGLVGGLLTIGLGVLLLLSDGTTALQGVLGSADQVALEDWVRRASAGVPDGLVVAVVVLVALVVALVAAVGRDRRRSHPRPVSQPPMDRRPRP